MSPIRVASTVLSTVLILIAALLVGAGIYAASLPTENAVHLSLTAFIVAGFITGCLVWTWRKP